VNSEENINIKKEKFKQSALKYHEEGRPGKIEISSTKPCLSARDLSLAYTPGVAAPCEEIAKNPEDVYKYTAKGNLVGVVSNGTAVLGLGNIGPLASKPVMEGKGVLFKRFADIDVFDIEINETTVEGVVKAVKALEPTFGGINLEDIKAPECFEIEKQLIEIMDIPVFHDDQHGTAIIASAGFINALEISNRKIEDVHVVFSGAGAAAMACANLFIKLGVKPNNLLMADSKGIIYTGRTAGMNIYKEKFAVETQHRTLSDALAHADAFIGCSAKGVLTKEMVKTMPANPIIFAMANPDPEIMPEDVAAVRDDAIMATGRSDYPNQVNNVLGFPFIFRGALDVRAKKINEEMKLAAVYALAELAKEEVTEEVKVAYGNQNFKFGKNYLIPKPFDKRVLTKLAPAIAKAAMDSGVARLKIDNMDEYALELEARLGQSSAFMRNIKLRSSKEKNRTKIVFTDGINMRILKSVSILKDEGVIEPVLLGNHRDIHNKMDELGLEDLKDLKIIRPSEDPNYKEYVQAYHEERKRKGASLSLSYEVMKTHNYFASSMVKYGHADGMITGATQSYPECVRPVMRVLGNHKKYKSCGVIILVFKQKVLFFTDCTAQVNPDSKDLCSIALSTAQLYQRLMLKKPRIAFLSYSNFGSSSDESASKMAKAATMAKKLRPDLEIDGEMQADVAVNQTILEKMFDFSDLKKPADLLVFPDLNSANISYKLLSQLGGATPIGPILTPVRNAVNIVQRTSTVEEIVNMSHLTALIAQEIDKDNL
jgi:malate dehydrogenase (oxaloacetate-decarboxylating)(NADP+)